MEFIKENYRLTVEEDSEGFDINLYQINDAVSPLIYLNLKPLNAIDTEYDDKLQVRDIPRQLFNDGDYYQSSATKYNKSEPFKKTSLLDIVHTILVENKAALKNIKRIFSSSLNCYQEENFITEDAKRFWEKQFAKHPNFPIYYFEDDKRYYLLLEQNLSQEI